jgi:transcriptional regulator with XRE-family HTH domain
LWDARGTLQRLKKHVGLVEHGRINITVNTARQIAHVLEISLAELFRGLN